MLNEITLFDILLLSSQYSSDRSNNIDSLF